MADDEERRARLREESRLRREERRAQYREERRRRSAEKPNLDVTTNDEESLGGFEKAAIAVGVVLIAIIKLSYRAERNRRIDDNRFRWTDKNRWE